MKGVLINAVEDVITAHLGNAVWDPLLEAADIDHGHTALGSYSDQEMTMLAAAAADALGQSPREVTVRIGERAIPYFYARYPYFFENYRRGLDARAGQAFSTGSDGFSCRLSS